MTLRQWLIIGAAFAALGPSLSFSAEVNERWLFVGRRTDTGWNPPSVSVSAPAYPLKAGNTIVVGRHALAYGAVNCRIVDAAQFKAYEEVSSSVELVRAGKDGLEIIGAPIECPSVCGAKTVWVKVRVPAARLLQIDH